MFRACKKGFKFRVCAVRVRFLRGSMSADQISAELIDTIASHMQLSVADVLAWMTDCVAANLASYRDSLAGPFPYALHESLMLLLLCLTLSVALYVQVLGPQCLSSAHGQPRRRGHGHAPHVDEYMGYYNRIVGQSNYAIVHFAEITGCTPRRKSRPLAGSR